LPFVVPPSRVSVGAGPISNQLDERAGREPAGGVASLRAGLHPLQALDAAPRHWFDPGAGYQLEGPLRAGAPHVHGPYLDLGVYPMRLPLAEAAYLRWGGRIMFDYLFLSGNQTSEHGFGGALVTNVEVTAGESGAFVNADEESAVAGLVQGQWGFGLFAGAETRRFGGAHYEGLTFGITLRVPFLVGVICCALPWNDDEAPPVAAKAKRRSTPARPGSEASDERRREREGDSTPKRRRPSPDYEPARPTPRDD
jgi:hypothetical protein